MRIRRSQASPARAAIALALAALFAAALGGSHTLTATAAEKAAPSATSWTLVKFPQGQPTCTGVGWQGYAYYDRLDCGFGYVGVSETAPTSVVRVSFITSDGATQATQTTTYRSADAAWQFTIQPGNGTTAAAWPPGEVTIRVTEVNGASGNFGETTILLNQLGATLAPLPKPGGGNYAPGDAVTIGGSVYAIDSVPPLAAPQETGVPASFKLRVRTPAGDLRGPYGPFTAASDGTFQATLPGAATAGLTATAETNYEVGVAIELVEASYTHPLTGQWGADRAGAGSLVISVPPATLILENSFVSAVGWVKPGETYPFRVFVKNFMDAPQSGAVVTIPPVDGMRFTNVAATGASIGANGSITWNVGTVPAATDAGPSVKTLVAEARASTFGEDKQIVWKNLSTTATLTYAGGPALASASLGPKVIPPSSTYETARYGFRPFPVVPVDYFDRKHQDAHTGDALASKINSASVPGSTFNLYQEMSYGQLHPHGTVPSAGLATAGWDYEKGFRFTSPQPQGACYGTSYKDLRDSALYPERIRNGWYQLPGDTAYYGADAPGSALPGVLLGVGPLAQIDNACGPIGKAVYDAAAIADPEIDYSDYDTDKDGVVDFFMMVFVGAGGNGVSQTSVPPYDNIWPHSSSLEFYYSDPETGLKGYVSDDQLKDHHGRPLYYANASRTTMTTTATEYPVYVRVGPYNVNPEAAIDRASVISHEYGHSLGLPDFYSLGGRATYGDWNLMATDKSQHMDVFSKQELGWLVPRELQPGETTITGWQDSKRNTKRIDWVDPDGNPYTLEGESVNNGEAYTAKLPARQILDPAKFEPGPGVGASASRAWWSRSGNDFGCPPMQGHNLDIYLPELAEVPAGTPVRVTFKSYWDIEWDYDYGFVLYSTDGGETYSSLASAQGYTTATFNPNANSCQTQFGNGLTGTSGSYEANTQELDRLLGDYPSGGFLADEYDLSAAAGKGTVLRFTYATDPGLARPGWFVDDLRITAGDTVIYETDFESSGDPDDPRVFNGGCKDQLRTASLCTAGWQYVDASAGSAADHGYYLELRDRSGFDASGRGENDRAAIAFQPGLLLVYTDEAHGYGNVGTDDPPAQTPLDSVPQPGNRSPNLNDAAFTASAGRTTFSDSGAGWVDNYTDPANPESGRPWRLKFDCLGFQVLTMAGTGVGPEAIPPYDLTADVRLTRGPGCAPLDYGFDDDLPNQAPTAVAQARPTDASVGEEVTFDGSASYDDLTSAEELEYEWDFDGDGDYDETGQTARHAYDAAGTYEVALRVTDDGGLSGTDTITITVEGAAAAADLQVSEISAGNNKKAREGEKVTITATIVNGGTAEAAASKTELRLDGETVLGLVDTPAIAGGATVQVSLDWDTRSVKGEHTLRATADATGLVAESNEGNNAATLTVTVKGNKVQNGSFEQASSDGSGPAAWQGQSTAAGEASWSDGGSDGEKSASTTGNGGNAALAGSPSWTSEPIAVTPGETLDLAASVNAAGVSTAPGVGVVYLGGAGQVLSKVTAISAPTLTLGFQRLEQPVTIPAGAVAARVVLSGFTPLDFATRGTVTFDDVGLFER